MPLRGAARAWILLRVSQLFPFLKMFSHNDVVQGSLDGFQSNLQGLESSWTYSFRTARAVHRLEDGARVLGGTAPLLSEITCCCRAVALQSTCERIGEASLIYPPRLWACLSSA